MEYIFPGVVVAVSIEKKTRRQKKHSNFSTQFKEKLLPDIFIMVISLPPFRRPIAVSQTVSLVPVAGQRQTIGRPHNDPLDFLHPPPPEDPWVGLGQVGQGSL